MPWYRTGTVAITAGQTTVTGTGTNFSANARVGDALLGPDGNWYEVTNIASTTVLSILPAYKGTTISGGTYAITPVQGYTKTLADKFNDIANTWGSTLAGLGSVSTENVVPVTKGGTGGTTQATARNGLGLKSAAVADIVGTVSQSGGVPTGAIYERGNNANGHYTKYADGTLIQWGAFVLTDAIGLGNSNTAGGYRSAQMAITYPTPFATRSAETNLPVVLDAYCNNNAYGVRAFPAEDNSVVAGQFVLTSSGSSVTVPASTLTIRWKAVGRWY
ncbi:hypothetical protein [Pseudomonas putida]|uniref:Uncharacterized protein n=1 Tax=Pseudomonas putida TaxID=303 RepID=A0A1X1A492_PSEPU|nr:hypothetical protein [Pseudomonas putida]ORL66617.1 hypothetical protein B7H17_04875 [Pseudomonas putida]